MSDNVSTYVTEQKAQTVSEAAVMADECVLIRKGVHHARNESRGSDSPVGVQGNPVT